MQPYANYNAVTAHNRTAAAISETCLVVGKVPVKVELYRDYYKNLNARLFIYDKLVDTQWNNGIPEFLADQDRTSRRPLVEGSWVLHSGKRKTPKGIAQYAFSNLVGDAALTLRRAAES